MLVFYIHDPCFACSGVVFGQTYPERIITDLEEHRSRSLQDVAAVRREFGQYVDKHSGCDLIPLPPRLVSEALGSSHRDEVVGREGKQFLLPLITRMEFKYQLENPDEDAASNPYNAVLKGYVSRKRDETIAFFNERDFKASVMCEGVQRRERLERDHRRMEELPSSPSPRGRARRTPTAKDRFSVVPSGSVTSIKWLKNEAKQHDGLKITFIFGLFGIKMHLGWFSFKRAHLFICSLCTLQISYTSTTTTGPLEQKSYLQEWKPVRC